MHSGDELIPTFPAHGQAAEVLAVDPLGVMQHVDHLPEREQRVPVPPRGDAPDRAERVESDKVECVSTRLASARDRAPVRRHAVLHVRGEEGRDGALHHFPPTKGEDEVVVRELDGQRVLHEHRRRETRRRGRERAVVRPFRCGRCRGGAILGAGYLEYEVGERFGARRGLRRSVSREVVKRGWEDGAYVEFAREVDDVDRGGDLVARVVVAVGGERHAFAAVPLDERRGEVALQAFQALSARDGYEVFAR